MFIIQISHSFRKFIDLKMVISSKEEVIYAKTFYQIIIIVMHLECWLILIIHLMLGVHSFVFYLKTLGKDHHVIHTENNSVILIFLQTPVFKHSNESKNHFCLLKLNN